MIDISYLINENMAIYPNNPAFSLRYVQSISAGDTATVSELFLGTHTGTHIDAPAHFIEGGEAVDEIALERMNGKARVLDLTGYSEIDAFLLGRYVMGSGGIVLIKTNNSLIWNCDRILDDYATLTYDGAEYIAEQGVSLVGIDYLTIERPRNKREDGKSVHKTLLGNGVLICEGLNLKDVQEGEYVFRCLPLNIFGADGCPVRAVLE